MPIHRLTIYIYNRAFTYWFVDIVNVWLGLIRGYNKWPIKKRRFVHSVIKGQENARQRPIWAIENARGWQISDKGQLRAIENAQERRQLNNNVQQRPIWMHIKCTGTHRRSWECMGKTNNVKKKVITNVW